MESISNLPWPEQRHIYLAKQAADKRMGWLAECAEQGKAAEQRGIARRAAKPVELIMTADRKIPGKFRFTLMTGEPLGPGIYEATIKDFKWSDE